MRWKKGRRGRRRKISYSTLGSSLRPSPYAGFTLLDFPASRPTSQKTFKLHKWSSLWHPVIASENRPSLALLEESWSPYQVGKFRTGRADSLAMRCVSVCQWGELCGWSPLSLLCCLDRLSPPEPQFSHLGTGLKQHTLQSCCEMPGDGGR